MNHFDALGIDAERLAEIIHAEREGRCVILPQTVDDDYPGLKVKYRVFKARNNEPVEDCFVLRPDKDSAARQALFKYANECNNPVLAKEIVEWIARIYSGMVRDKEGSNAKEKH